MAGVKNLEELAHPDYWDQRYRKNANNELFEWLKPFKSIEPLLSAHLPKPVAAEDGGPQQQKQPRILHLGCGNSSLPMDLYDQGYNNQVCVDFSKVVIQDMASRFSEKEGIDWKVADVRDMRDFSDGEFDAAIDKSTLDTMMHGSIWDPPEDVRRSTGSYIDEVARVLKPGGCFICITYRQPHFVKPTLVREGVWDFAVVELEQEAGTFDYYGFVMKKI